jgi:hypothetical protein
MARTVYRCTGAHRQNPLRPDDARTWAGRNVYRSSALVAVCELLHRRGATGATELLGVVGTPYGGRERAVFFSRNAGTLMMVIAVGLSERMARCCPSWGGLLRRPLLALD